MKKQEIEKEKKLIWKGTVGEAIKEGKLTQEEVNDWNTDDDEERIYNEGYEQGSLSKEKEVLKILDEYKEDYRIQNIRAFVEELKQKIKSK